VRFSPDIIIWSIAGVLLTFVVINVIQWIMINVGKEHIPDVKREELVSQAQKVFKTLNVVAVGTWIIIVFMLVLFHGISLDPEYETVKSKTYEDVRGLEVSTAEQIRELNRRTVTVEEEERSSRVSAGKEEARREYEKFLNESVKSSNFERRK
jgi:hypothetical protein